MTPTEWPGLTPVPGAPQGPHDLGQEIAHLRVRLDALGQLVADLLLENERLRRSGAGSGDVLAPGAGS